MSFHLGNNGIYTGGVDNAWGYAGYQERERGRRQREAHERDMAELNARIAQRKAASHASTTNSSSNNTTNRTHDLDLSFEISPETKRLFERARESQQARLRERKRLKQERHAAWKKMTLKAKVLHVLWIICPARIVWELIQSVRKNVTDRWNETCQRFNSHREFGYGIRTMNTIVAPVETFAAKRFSPRFWIVISSLTAFFALAITLPIVGTWWGAIPAGVCGFYLPKMCKCLLKVGLVYIFAWVCKIGTSSKIFCSWTARTISMLAHLLWKTVVFTIKAACVVAVCAIGFGLINLFVNLN